MMIFNSLLLTLFAAATCLTMYILDKKKTKIYLIMSIYFSIGSVDKMVKDGFLKDSFINPYWESIHVAVMLGITAILFVMIVKDIKEIRNRRRTFKSGEKSHLNDGKAL